MAPTRDAAAESAVEVWVLDLDHPSVVPADLAQLDAAELARARALPPEPHGRRYASSRIQLRRLLAALCGLEPAEVVFVAGAAGKPALRSGRQPHLRFNTSRSAGTGLVAVAVDGREVGVDLELRRPGIDLTAVADRFFPAAERDRIARLPAAEQLRAAYDCWTRIEAELKGIGTGLAGLPRAAAARTDTDTDTGAGSGSDTDTGAGCDAGEPSRRTGESSDWSVVDLDVGPDFSAAVAAQRSSGQSVTAVLRRWPRDRPPAPGSTPPASHPRDQHGP